MQLMIGYFLTSISDDKTRRQCVLQLEKDCQGVGEEQNYDSGLVILFAGLFYAFFVFDIYGDAAGWKGASIISLILVLIPTVIWTFRMTSLHNRVKSLFGGGRGGAANPKSDPTSVDNQHNPLHHPGKKTQQSISTAAASEDHSSEMVRMSSASQVF
jgi:hypothetical protein